MRIRAKTHKAATICQDCLQYVHIYPLSATLGGMYYYCPHFKEENIEAQKGRAISRDESGKTRIVGPGYFRGREKIEGKRRMGVAEEEMVR